MLCLDCSASASFNFGLGHACAFCTVPCTAYGTAGTPRTDRLDATRIERKHRIYAAQRIRIGNQAAAFRHHYFFLVIHVTFRPMMVSQRPHPGQLPVPLHSPHVPAPSHSGHPPGLAHTRQSPLPLHRIHTPAAPHAYQSPVFSHRSQFSRPSAIVAALVWQMVQSVQWELKRNIILIPSFESLHKFPFQTGSLYIPKLQV